MSNAPIEIVPISLLNIREAFCVAKKIFPEGWFDIALRYLTTQIPKKALSQMSKIFGPVKLKTLDYYAAKETTSGRIIGVSGLYAFDKTDEAWLGWFGISEDKRGNGYGSALLDLTIHKAREN